MMVMTALRGMLMGAAFPLTGFSELPKAGSTPQQLGQQSGQPTSQQLIQQTPLSAASIPPELIQRLPNISREQVAMIRAMHARFGGTGRNIGLQAAGNVGESPGSTFQPGTANPVTQQHQQIPSGIGPEMMQAFVQRKQDGGG